MRSFIGIPVPEDALPALARVQASLELGRVVDPENWHITLAFLGDQDEHALEDLHEGLSALRTAPFDVAVVGVDVLGGAQPKVLAAQVEPKPELVALRRAVRGAVHQAGIDLPRVRFRPHITLARFKRSHTLLETQRVAGVLEAYADVDAGRLAVTHFALYRSHLGPGGARYEVLAEYPLQG